ncbi:hypothetical protein M427DRAFT_41157 [Gonapodya prolifera JEL478]|uniref:Cilia- and flagella-associated protein 58 central coiled coil domain-containing protein n=1 Tax=Gonapodya prolifera (strain JEL478) TaxID=1344416 RepID=A0A139AX26_GONPJ|nr:hypothetical protein M427DRAFT_41157 [Gonapodya prolifera JEL478]|eukprot:KXS21025.1 hypothetical protein M427DRAFT_41157 [Gonapodya prolifera JEL478]
MRSSPLMAIDCFKPPTPGLQPQNTRFHACCESWFRFEERLDGGGGGGTGPPSTLSRPDTGRVAGPRSRGSGSVSAQTHKSRGSSAGSVFHDSTDRGGGGGASPGALNAPEDRTPQMTHTPTTLSRVSRTSLSEAGAEAEADPDPTDELRRMKDELADLVDDSDGGSGTDDIDVHDDDKGPDADAGSDAESRSLPESAQSQSQPTSPPAAKDPSSKPAQPPTSSSTSTAAKLKSLVSSMRTAGSLDLPPLPTSSSSDDTSSSSTDPLPDPAVRALELIAEAESHVLPSAFVTINPASSPSPTPSPGAGTGSNPSSASHRTPTAAAIAPPTATMDFVSLRGHITHLTDLLTNSRRSETVLRSHVLYLSDHMKDDAARVRQALSLAIEDRARMSRMKKELRRAWALVEKSGEREQRARRDADEFKRRAEAAGGGGEGGDVGQREREREEGDAEVPLSLSKRYTSTEEIKDRRIDELEAQLCTLRAQFASLENIHTVTATSHATLQTQHASLRTSHAAATSQLSETQDALAAARLELDRCARDRERGDAARRAEHDAAERAREDAARALAEAGAKQAEAAGARYEARDLAAQVERAQGELERAAGRVARVQADAVERQREVDALLGKMRAKDEELRAAQVAAERWREECGAAGRRTEGLERRVRRADEELAKIVGEKEEYKNKYSTLLRDLHILRTESSHVSHARDSALRDRDLLEQRLHAAEADAKRERERTVQAEQSREVAEREVGGLRKENGKMRKLILALERARDAQLAESDAAARTLRDCEEDVKVAELQAVDRGKKIAELERKLGEQQALYETVRADRNLYSKHLLEAESTASHLRNKLDTVAHQCAQLKEELASKEAQLQRSGAEKAKLEARCDAVVRDVARAGEEVRAREEELRRIKGEAEALRRAVEDGERDAAAKAKDHALVVAERDSLGRELVRVRSECVLLEEKGSIQRAALERGEAAYAARGEDVRVLRMEVRRLRRERALVGREASQVAKLREEVVGVRRDLLRERARVKVLEEELETPLNVHRWRPLAGTDPTMSDLISKMHMLQRRLISKTEEVVEREQAIAQRDATYARLKEQLARAPGVEVIRSLAEAREAAKIKGKECRALASELTMYATQLASLRSDVTRLNMELQLEKKRHFSAKKRLHEREKKERELREALGGTPGNETSLGGQVAEAVAVLIEKAATASGKKRVDPGLTLLPRYVGGGYLVSKPVAT